MVQKAIDERLAEIKSREERLEQERRINAEDKALKRRNAEIFRKQREQRLAKENAENDRQQKILEAEQEQAKKQYFDNVYRNRNWFEAQLKEIGDMLGSVSLGSIETNGNTMINKKRQNELAIDGANAHIELENARAQRQYLDRHRNYLLDNKIYDEQDVQRWYEEAAASNDQILKNQDLLDKEKAYKELFVRKHTSSLGYFFDEVGRGIKWLGATKAGKAKSIEERQNDLEAQYQNLVQQDLSLHPLGVAVAQQFTDSNAFNASQLAAQAFQKELELENQGLDDEYEANRQHLKNAEEYWNITNGYERVGQAYRNNSLFNPYHFFFNVPRTIGTSNGSPSQAASNIIRGVGTVGSIAAAPFSGGASFASLYLSELAATPFDIKGGVDENHAETTDKQIESIIRDLNDDSFTGDSKKDDKSTYTEFIKELKDRSKKIWKAKGWSDQQIEKFYGGKDGDRRAISDFLQGLTRNIDIHDDQNGGEDLHFGDYANPLIQQALDNAQRGSLALFDADNMATMQEIPIQKFVALMPFRGMKWGSRPFDRVTSITRNAAERGAAGAVEQGVKYTNNFTGALKSGWNKGMASGVFAGTGMIGGSVAGAVGAAANAVAYGARRLSPSLDGFIRGLEKNIATKWQYGIDRYIGTEIGRQIALKYGLRFATSKALEVASEMAEEGRQNLHKREDYGKLYGYGGMGYVDAIANDLSQGRKVLDAYLSVLNIGDSPMKNDRDFWNDVRGVIPTVLFGNSQSVIQTYAYGKRGFQEFNAAEALELSAILNREYQNNNRAQLTNVVNASFRGRRNAVLDAIQGMQDADARRETPMFQQEDYENLRRDAEEVMRMANNKTLRNMLEAKGFKYGTHEYATAIADLYTLEQQRLDGQENLKPYNQRLEEIYSSDVYKSFINRQTRRSAERRAEVIREARNKAMIEEIKKIDDEAGVEFDSKKHDRMTQDPAYQQRVNQAMEDAEMFAGQMFDQQTLANEAQRRRIMNKLIGLLELKRRMSTIDDYFKTMHDKFSLYSKRPDASVVKNSIQREIDKTRMQLYELSDNLRVGLSDVDLLQELKDDEAFEGTDSKWDEEARQLEAYKSLINASLAVTDSYYEQFRYGLVEVDGVWRYNPNEYHARRQELSQATRLLRTSLKDQARDFMNTASEREVLAPNQQDQPTDVYRQRIDKIIKAAEENNKIQWMINDAASGDAITQFRDTVRKQYAADRKASNEALNAQAKRLQADPFGSQQRSGKQPSEQSQQQTVVARGKRFEQRRQKAQKTLSKYKSKYEKWKRSSMTALPIPFADTLVKAGFELAKNAIDGVYKFAEFVQDMSDLLSEKGIDMKDALPYIRRGYNKSRQYFQINKPDVLQNMSTAEEIFDFQLFDDSDASAQDPQPEPFFDAIQRRIDEDSRRIINDDSFYDIFVQDDDGVHIYPNIVGIEHNEARFGAQVRTAATWLKSRNNSDQEFRDAISQFVKTEPQFPIDFYVKYRNVEGIEEAVARRFYTFTDREYVINGNKVRNAAIAAALGKEDQLDRTKYPDNLDQFIRDAKQAFQELSGQGIRILTTKKHLYGVVEGRRMSVDADIIAINDQGEIFVIDVRYTSYQNIFDILDEFKRYTGYSTREQVIRQVNAVDDIIRSKFGRTVKEDYLLPVTYNTNKNFEFGIQLNWHNVNGNKKGLYPIKQRPNQNQPDPASQQEQLAKELVDQINARINEYEDILSEALKYGSTYQHIGQITLQQFETADEYQRYMDMLREKLDTISARIEELNSFVLSNIQFETQVWVEQAQTITTPSQDAQAIFYALEDKCKELDIIRDFVLSLRPTEQVERDRINKMYQLVFEAQKLLDELLSHPEASTMDVTQEEEIIASTMEVMAENKKNFGAMNKFMMRWWATNFTKVGDYIAVIKSWMNTLENHIMNDLDGHYALQEWYSALLNNYFTVLLDNASDAAKTQPVAYQQAIEQLIQLAREDIQKFNDLWDVSPDSDFPGPAIDEVDRINRMRVRWPAKYGMTTKHWPSINEMNEFDVDPKRAFYYIMSTSPTFVSSYKAQVGPAEMPQDHSTRFRLENNNGVIQLHINWWDGKHWVEKYLSFQTDLTKFPQEYWEDLAQQNRGNQWFIRKAKAMLDYVATHPDYTISFTVNTDNGSIHYDKDGEMYSVQDFLFKGTANQHDLYTISLSQQDRVGITRFIDDVTLNQTFYNVHTGSDLSQRLGSIGEGYDKHNTAITTGLVVYKYNYGDGTGIWVPIPAVSIGNDDAILLVDLITDYARGVRVKDGYDILGLLSQRLYIADPQKRISKYNNLKNMIRLGDNGNLTIGKDAYNVFSDRQRLVERISEMPNSTSSEMLSSSMNSSTDPVMSTVRQNIIDGAQEIKLPNGFVIKREDITHDNRNGSYGSTWLGYLLRNNYLMTTSRGAGYRQVNIDNLVLVKKGQDQQARPQQQVDQRRQAMGRRAAINAQHAQNGSGLAMTVTESEIDVNRSVEEREDFVKFVNDYFKQVLTDNPNAIVEFSDDPFLKNVGPTDRVVGITLTEMIKLSKYAPYSAAWHEAFHKILELTVDDNLREQFYDIYRKKYHVEGDRAIAEGLADLFVSYMENRKAVSDAKGFSKIYKWFKKAGFALGLTWHVGLNNAKTLFNFYRDINAGKYKTDRGVDANKAQRFKDLFNEELYYTVRGYNFEHLADSGQVAEMVEALSFYILDSYDIQKLDPDISEITIDDGAIQRIDKDVVDNLTGEGIPEDQLTEIDFAFREVFKEGEKQPIVATKGKNKGQVIGYRKTYPAFAVLKPDIVEYIKSILNGDYRGKIDDIEADDPNDIGENRDAASLNIDRFDRASFEFSKLEGVNKRVKLFFSTIPAYTQDMEYDYTRNYFNCPVFLPIEKVYNVLTNAFHDVQSINELNEQLRVRGLFDPMANAVYRKFNKIVKDIYKYDENGVITDIDFDKESFAIQILNAIRSQKNDFIVARSKSEKDHGKSINITSSSLNRDQFNFPRQWSLYLQAGQVSVFSRSLDQFGNWQFNSGAENTFNEVSQFIKELRSGLFSVNPEITVLGQNYVKDSSVGIDRLKNDFILQLHRIGIMFERDALDHMLTERFGGIGADQFSQFISQFGTASIQPFLDRIESFTRNGVPVKENIKQGYEKVGFVIELAKWQGEYNRITTQQMSLGLNGKRLYSVSQNSSISHIINMLNTLDLDNETIQTLLGFNYNITNLNGVQIGSIIAKAIASARSAGNPIAMKAHTYIGFKTDNRGDMGTEYLDEATVDDYMAKLTMLQKGYLIFPTLSDKGTYVIISFDDKSGVKIPGMQFEEITNVTTDSFGAETETVEQVVRNTPKIRFIGGNAYILPHESVINQMLEYAETEKAAIEQCMIDVETLPESAKIKNYHTPNKDKETKKVVEPNGTRFLSLTKIAVVEDGKLNVYNLNNPNESSKRMLELANEKFFSKPIEERREIMGLTMAIQGYNEVDTAVDLGIVQRVNRSGQWTDKSGAQAGFSISADSRSLMNLETTQLNETQLETLTSEILKTLPHKDYGTWLNVPTTQGAEKQFRYKVARSLAIATILSDASYRSIICSQEIQRCFSGHPALFKVNYDIKAGKIKDSAFDIQKRIGGMISTGEDNVLNLPGIDNTYVCAEVEDYEVPSSSKIASQLDDMFVKSHVKEIFANLLINAARKNKDFFYNWYQKNFGEIPAEKALDDVAEEIAYKMSFEDILEKAPQQFKDKLEKAKQDGLKYASSYKSGINVADGAAYITDKMCENMLRMRGAYNNAVKKAFDILRGDEKYSWTQKRDAYDVVYKAVNIVTTKYTAYGFRQHLLNGQKQSDVSIAYYNKFALFPLFHCISTGRMSGIYQKMLNEGVDMLLMTSAVKVGSQGAVKFDGESINAPFNKYIQSYAYLRRQLNTDPEEGDKITMGTQMVKIALQNLRKKKTYTDSRTGEDITGEEVLDRFMSSIRALSNIGMSELHEIFYTDDHVDQKKLSKYLKEQLTARNANKALLEAIEVDGNGNLTSVLAATPDASWIESILISTVNKKVIDIVTPGSSFVQRSVFAIEDKQKEGEGSIQSDANMPRSINNGEKLQMINNDGSMDAVVSMDYFDDILFVGKMKDMSFAEKRKWLIDNNIIGQGAKANTIGYRIPTQAQSSIHALRFVDVIEAVKSTIILPEEFTKITGSDFDIDHLYLCSYNYNDQQNTEFSKNSKEWYENTIIDCLMTLLKDGDSTNSLYKSIDNDTELITNIADQIEETGSTKDDPYNFGTLHEQILRKNDYITGKFGIGPYALNVTNQILTYLYGVKFKHTKFTEATGIERFDNVIDEDDHMVSSWLSAFINAHVDIVKDPYISKLNVNKFTYNMSNLLIRCGFGDVTLWFLAQPIIRELSKANNLANSQYSRDTIKKTGGRSFREQAMYEAALKFLNEEDLSQTIIDRYSGSDPKFVQSRIDAVLFIKQNKELLEAIAKNPTAENVVVNGQSYNVKHVQKKVFYAWKSLEKYAMALSNLVQHTKIDTRKQGKTLIAQQQYFDAYKNLFESAEESVWDIESLNRLANDSWIRLKTYNAIKAPMRILGDQTFNANKEFLKAVIKFGRILQTEPGALNVDTLNVISRSLQTAVKSEYIINYAKDVLKMTDDDITGLFFGKDSMNKMLVRLKNAIETDPRFARLKSNHFLNQIYSMMDEQQKISRYRMIDSPSFITVLDNVDDSRVNSNLLIDGWTDLLNDENQYVRRFARQMIVYSFLSSGEFKGWNKLWKYVPPAWLRGDIDQYKSFSDHVKQALGRSRDSYDKYFDMVVGNNFMDYRFSAKYNQTDKLEDGTYSNNFISINSRTNVPIVKIGKPVRPSDTDSVERYITVRGTQYNSKGLDKYDLYKLAGFAQVQGGVSPVYVKIKKLGYHTDHGLDIYQYGWNMHYLENEDTAFSDYDTAQAFNRIKEAVENNSEFFDYAKADAKAISGIYFSQAQVVEQAATVESLSSEETEEQEEQYEEPTIDNWTYLEDSGNSGSWNDLTDLAQQARQACN